MEMRCRSRAETASVRKPRQGTQEEVFGRDENIVLGAQLFCELSGTRDTVLLAVACSAEYA